MHFELPWAWLLAIPLCFYMMRMDRTQGWLRVLRLAALITLLFGLSEPVFETGGKGLDLMILCDQSHSMPPEPDQGNGRMIELIQAAENLRQSGARVGIVLFGEEAKVERKPEAQELSSGFAENVSGNASDLAKGLDLALDLIPGNHQGRVLILSDGEYTGGDPELTAQRAIERGIPIDHRFFERLAGFDLSVRHFWTPAAVRTGEIFQLTAILDAPKNMTVSYRLRRMPENTPIASGTTTLNAGTNRLSFQDRLTKPGTQEYRLETEAAEDTLPENNQALGAVFVEAPPRVLLVSPFGTGGNLAKALSATSLKVDALSPKDPLLTRNIFDGYRTVILENIAVEDLPKGAVMALKNHVENLGDGLFMTGGKRAFGLGGYYKSALEETLPVSLDQRKQKRKSSVAIAVALDRSGSMACPVGNGLQKIDLADQGTASVIELAGPADQIAVIAVDSSPHLIIPMGPVEDQAKMIRKVRSIRSEGGGIFIHEALVAAQTQLLASPKGVRHLILFADAADSEEEGDYKTLLQEFEKQGITVSVIGLGKPTDQDAKLLEDIARLGKGRCIFTDDPNELPRLFSQETLIVAKSSFKDETTATLPTPALRLIGDTLPLEFPAVGGFNVADIRPGASEGIRLKDEDQSPLFAFWHRGLGRVATFLGEADGPYSGPLAAWKNYQSFFGTTTKWLEGEETPDWVSIQAKREGREGIVEIEIDPSRVDEIERPVLKIVSPDGDASSEATCVWQDQARLEARFAMPTLGLYRLAIDLGKGRHLRAPSLCLPYPPEFEPRWGMRSGAETLKRLAEISGGTERVGLDSTLFDTPKNARGQRPLWCLAAFLLALILLLEWVERRLAPLSLLTPRIRRLLQKTWGRTTGNRPETKKKTAPTKTRATGPTEEESPTLSTSNAATEERPAEPSPQEEKSQTIAAPPQNNPPAATLDDAFTRAKRRTKR